MLPNGAKTNVYSLPRTVPPTVSDHPKTPWNTLKSNNWLMWTFSKTVTSSPRFRPYHHLSF